MPELIALYLSSIFLIGALALLGRHNRQSGWRRKRGALVEEIQETMETFQSLQPSPATPGWQPGALTPEKQVAFTNELTRLQAHLARHGSVAPEPVRPPVAKPEVSAPVRRVPRRLAQ